MHSNPASKFLPNLNSLRFFAAAAVVFSHIDNALVNNSYKANFINFFPFNFGLQAVNFFFVLSGYLITYLLLIEKKTYKINIRSFYIKRIFRIWPLYYLIIMIAFFFLNNSSFFFWNNITNSVSLSAHPLLFTILLGLILPNIALLATPTLGYATPTWSIGVEEQFYLIWPWIIKRERPLGLILAIILAGYLLSHDVIYAFITQMNKSGVLSTGSIFYIGLKKINTFFTFNFSFKIDSMAIGALAAFIVNKQFSLLNLLFSRLFQIILYVVVVVLLVYANSVPYQFYSLIFALIILNLSINKKTIFSIENKTLNYLGKISYGIYMFHALTIIPVIKMITYFSNQPIHFWNEIVICIFCLILSVGIASFSYHFYEGYFRTLRKRFLNENIVP